MPTLALSARVGAMTTTQTPAASRIRVSAEPDGTFVASVDGEPTWRTNRAGNGVWDAYQQQIVGTVQVQGRAAFRRWVVAELERLAQFE